MILNENKLEQGTTIERDVALFNDDVDRWDNLISMVHEWHMGIEHAWNDTDRGKPILEEKSVLVIIRTSQIPHGLVWDRTRASRWVLEH